MTKDGSNDGFADLGDQFRATCDRLSRRLTIMIWYLGVHSAFYAVTTVYLLILLFRDAPV